MYNTTNNNQTKEKHIQEGLVIKSQSGFDTVLADSGEQIVARIRGRLKKERSESTIVAVGDRVQWQTPNDGNNTPKDSGAIIGLLKKAHRAT